MIGRLRGVLVHKQPPHLLVEAHGVGYEVEASLSTFAQLPETGAEVTLHTHLLVREDGQFLYGFATLAERTLFRSLIRVSGVGPKLALLILSGMNVDAFARCVQAADAAALTRLPGIGKKTAERLIVEMRDRIDGMELGAPFLPRASGPADSSPSPLEDALSALVSLGYKLPEATRMVRGIDAEGLNSEEIIRRALQAVVRKG
ncbi:MAG: Holliday junction branch migration protein RuvA [Pseudomonadota bacterium]|nr:Holliday junction branch migration protein RuvA [Pseudomonadota bacterium]